MLQALERFLRTNPSPLSMPTVLRKGPYRVYFFSHDVTEPAHVHMDRDERSAKFWLDPVSLARNLGFTSVELRRIERLIRTNQLSLIEKWNEFFDARSW